MTRIVRHDDLCPCTRFHCDETHCTCGAASCEEDIQQSLKDFGRKLREINSMHDPALSHGDQP